VRQLDVTAGAPAIAAIVAEAAGVWGRLDVVVNNAGAGYPGLLEEGGCVLVVLIILERRGCLIRVIFFCADLTSSANNSRSISSASWMSVLQASRFYAHRSPARSSWWAAAPRGSQSFLCVLLFISGI
jgi:hypothetical protein